MSDKKKKSGPAHRLINPTVRAYMETLNLEKFYGGYVVNPISETVLNLGIGEVGNIPLDQDVAQIYQDFMAHAELKKQAKNYSGTMGEIETNDLVAKRLGRWLGADRFSDRTVVSTDGGQNAVSIAIRTFTAPLNNLESKKQYVLLAAPAYPYFPTIVASGAGFQAFLAYDGEMFTRGVETCTNETTGVILINVPNNPMGYALTAEQVGRINKVAEIYDAVIVVDMVYADYAPNPEVGLALAGFDPERTVFTDSFSKQFGLPGLRLGFAVTASEPLAYAMRFVKMAESLTPSNLKLIFGGHLLKNHAHIPQQIAETVAQRNAEFLEVFEPPPGTQLFPGRENPFYLALEITELCEKTGKNDTEIALHTSQRHNLRVFPGSFVYPHTALPHQTFTHLGRLNPGGTPPYLAPSQNPPQTAHAGIVYTPDFLKARRPLLRISFGSETRIEQAAHTLHTALKSL